MKNGDLERWKVPLHIKHESVHETGGCPNMKDIITCQKPLCAMQSLSHDALLFKGQGMTPIVQNQDQSGGFVCVHFWAGSPQTLATDSVSNMR